MDHQISLPEALEAPEATRPARPVFIVGSPRSGTTILANTLRRAGYSGFNEGHFISLLTPLKEAIDRQFLQSCAHDANQLLSNVDREGLTQDIFRVLQAIQSRHHADEPWFDKTPDAAMVRAAPFVAALWPCARFIFAKRRAIENIASRLKKFPETSFDNHCRYWSETMAAWRDVRESLNALEVDQYDIGHSPAATAARLGAFLGLTQERIAAMASEMATGRPQSTDADSTLRVLSLSSCGWSDVQTRVFKYLCGREMQYYGYTFDERYRRDVSDGAVAPPAETAG